MQRNTKPTKHTKIVYLAIALYIFSAKNPSLAVKEVLRVMEKARKHELN